MAPVSALQNRSTTGDHTSMRLDWALARARMHFARNAVTTSSGLFCGTERSHTRSVEEGA
jgi:hypothetical protein